MLYLCCALYDHSFKKEFCYFIGIDSVRPVTMKIAILAYYIILLSKTPFVLIA